MELNASAQNCTERTNGNGMLKRREPTNTVIVAAVHGSAICIILSSWPEMQMLKTMCKLGEELNANNDK